MQHQIQFGLLQSLYYRVGTGLYTNQKSLYFIDFLNFTRNNLPEQWNDQQSSSFQLLGADWYNASSKYFQIHLIYESPFFIIPRILKIMGERSGRTLLFQSTDDTEAETILRNRIRRRHALFQPSSLRFVQTTKIYRDRHEVHLRAVR
jgi:hypothetical protein